MNGVLLDQAINKIREYQKDAENADLHTQANDYRLLADAIEAHQLKLEAIRKKWLEEALNHYHEDDEARWEMLRIVLTT